MLNFWPKTKSAMNTKKDMAYFSDWQVMSYSGNEFENNRETDGNEEEMEFGFFSNSQEDHTSLEEVTKG